MTSVGIFTADRAELGLLTPVSKALVDVGIKPCWHHVSTGSFMAAANEATVQLAEAEMDDFYIVPCDRQEMVGVALELFTHNKPFAQFQAGDIGQGNQDEVYGWIITRCASLHFCNSSESAQRIIKSGEEPWRVQLVGSTAFDDIEPDEKWFEQAPESFVPKGPFNLVLVHPDTYSERQTEKDYGEAVVAMLSDKLPIVILGPNHDNGWLGIDEGWRFWKNKSNVIYYPDGLPRPQFLALMKHCHKFITNSSSAVLELPAFDITKWVQIGQRNAERKPLKDVEHGGSKLIADIIKNLDLSFEGRNKLLQKRFTYT